MATDSAGDYTELGAGEPEPVADIDDNGVDRAQIRRMLALSPRERLRWLQEIADDIADLRRLNGKRTIR